ncbi:hypothetical protein [Caproicibacterium sp. XB2]
MKFPAPGVQASIYPVAPYTGAWIEIWATNLWQPKTRSRSLHGSVD